MIKEEDITESIEKERPIKSSELTLLISDLENLTNLHQKNTKTIEQISKFDSEKLSKKILNSNDLSF